MLKVKIKTRALQVILAKGGAHGVLSHRPTMSELCVPLDYEQLPELWRLRRILGTRGTRPTENSPKQIETAANFLFHRLFVTLGYLARVATVAT